MIRIFAVLANLLLVVSPFAFAQSPPPTSDPTALALAAKAVAALTGGLPVGGVTLNANAISIAGSDYFTGTATLQAKGTTDSRFDLSVNGTTRTEIRTLSGGVPSGSWTSGSAAAKPFAQHNCWTDAAWFFPALSSITQAATSGFFFSYVGQEQHDGTAVQHVRIFQRPSFEQATSTVDELSTTDVYLDPVSFLPFFIAFQVHPDGDMKVNIPVEIRFANYQAVSGIQVPFHIQRLLNGGLVLDLTVTSAVMSSALTTPSSQVQQ